MSHVHSVCSNCLSSLNITVPNVISLRESQTATIGKISLSFVKQNKYNLIPSQMHWMRAEPGRHSNQLFRFSYPDPGRSVLIGSVGTRAWNSLFRSVHPQKQSAQKVEFSPDVFEFSKDFLVVVFGYDALEVFTWSSGREKVENINYMCQAQ